MHKHPALHTEPESGGTNWTPPHHQYGPLFCSFSRYWLRWFPNNQSDVIRKKGGADSSCHALSSFTCILCVFWVLCCLWFCSSAHLHCITFVSPALFPANQLLPALSVPWLLYFHIHLRLRHDSARSKDYLNKYIQTRPSLRATSGRSRTSEWQNMLLLCSGSESI